MQAMTQRNFQISKETGIGLEYFSHTGFEKNISSDRLPEAISEDISFLWMFRQADPAVRRVRMARFFFDSPYGSFSIK